MKLRITKLILATTATILLTVAALPGFAQQDSPGKPTAKEEMKKSGKEVGKAGTSLGHNVRHGRVVHGGKHFGRHVGRAGRHVGRGTKHAVVKAVKP